MKHDKPLVIKNFTKRYGKYRGVDDINLAIETGEVFGFLGPNGAGKSTTIRAILDFMTASSGTISIFGLDSHKDSVAAKNYIGYLAGDIAVYENMTGQKLLQHLSALGKKTDWAYVKSLAKKLEATLDQPIHALSKGNRQKIGLIQAFMHKPDLLILDEPTSGLDPLRKQVFYDMVLDMKNQAKTVFVSSHDLAEVQKICDRAAFVREGKLIAVEDIKNARQLNLRRLVVTFESKPSLTPFKSIKNITELKLNSDQLTATIKGSVAEFITEIAKLRPVDLYEQETSLEDIFMHFYKKAGKGE